MADILEVERIGPEADGRRMTLDEFRAVEFEEGYVYELARGVVVVADVPSYFHMLIALAIRNALVLYQSANPSRIFAVTTGTDSGLEIPIMQSRRHPDVSIYLTPPPTIEAQPWETWTPEIAIEVVSKSSRKRDYEDKPDDYHGAGVRLYWIVDPLERSATLLTRRSDTWRTQKIDASGALATGLLPGFVLSLEEIFAVLPPES